MTSDDGLARVINSVIGGFSSGHDPNDFPEIGQAVAHAVREHQAGQETTTTALASPLSRRGLDVVTAAVDMADHAFKALMAGKSVPDDEARRVFAAMVAAALRGAGWRLVAVEDPPEASTVRAAVERRSQRFLNRMAGKEEGSTQLAAMMSAMDVPDLLEELDGKTP